MASRLPGWMRAGSAAVTRADNSQGAMAVRCLWESGRVVTAASLAEDRLLYGCMGLGGTWDPQPYGAAEIAEAEAAIGAALDSGITTFDHADIYRHGKAEAVFGEVLTRSPELRERIVLQTKCGIRLAEGERPGFYDLRGKSIIRRVEGSLSRLRTDVIDVLLLHRPDPLADPDDIAQAVTTLHQQGLVRSFGVSNCGAQQITLLQRHLDQPLMVNQLEMSLYRRDWLEAGVLVNTPQAAANGFPFGTIEHCQANGIRLQAWGSLAQGRYSGRAQTATERRPSAWSRHSPRPRTRRLRRFCCGGCSGILLVSPRPSGRPVRIASEPAKTQCDETLTSPTKSGTTCGSPHEGLRCPRPVAGSRWLDAVRDAHPSTPAQGALWRLRVKLAGSGWSSRGSAAFDDHTFVGGELDHIAAGALLPARIGAEQDLPAREVRR